MNWTIYSLGKIPILADIKTRTHSSAPSPLTVCYYMLCYLFAAKAIKKHYKRLDHKLGKDQLLQVFIYKWPYDAWEWKYSIIYRQWNQPVHKLGNDDVDAIQWTEWYSACTCWRLDLWPKLELGHQEAHHQSSASTQDIQSNYTEMRLLIVHSVVMLC